ncbi:MAG: DNA polymerase III subunit epsilon [Gammaproteobacteria bacterium]|nr:DNA polymerase III subunit epsilon [Gammaproteobacteria bacterium]
MRQIILDTETTGLEPRDGHRIIEIGCVEIINRRKTDSSFHVYLNPEREIEDGAFDVHGLSNEFLSDKPKFSEVAQDLINFIRDSEVIIHNAPFDIAFIDSELERLGKQWGKLENYCVTLDTLSMARQLHPGQKNSLDALCQRYEVDNSKRELHGALLDAQILLDVYLSMTGGQTSLSLEEEEDDESDSEHTPLRIKSERALLKTIEPSDDELEAHHKILKLIEKVSGEVSVWNKTEQ